MQIELSSDQLNILADLVANKIVSISAPAKPQPKKETMTIREAAYYLQKSIISVRRYIRRPGFPVARKVGGGFLFSSKEIVAWFENEKKKEAQKIFRP